MAQRSSGRRSKPEMDMLKSQDGDIYVVVRNEGDEVVLPISMIVGDWTTTHHRLNQIGVHLVTNSAINDFKESVQALTPWSKCLAAASPGWLTLQHYIHPDGSMQGVRSDDTPLIDLLTPDKAFAARGTHKRWLEGIRPFYNADRGLRFAMWFGLCSLVLRHLETPQENPMMEVVGQAEVGKTTLCRAVASMFGGGSDGGLGIGRSANMTENAFLDLLQGHNDTLLYLDETNVADTSTTKSLGLIFNGASGESRARHGDTQRKARTRTAILLTGNISLSDHSQVDASIREAARTRLITKVMECPLFISVPIGYADRREAIGALSELIGAHHGTASRKFIRFIIDRETPIAKDTKRRQERFLKRNASDFKEVPYRIMRIYALIYAVGKMAIKAGVLPDAKVHGDVLSELESFTGYSNELRESFAKREFLSVLKAHFNEIATVKNGKDNSSKSVFGAWRQINEANTFIFMTHQTARTWFGPEVGSLLKAIKREGLLKAEPDKNTIKAPLCVPTTVRVHKFILTPQDWKKVKQAK